MSPLVIRNNFEALPIATDCASDLRSSRIPLAVPPALGMLTAPEVIKLKNLVSVTWASPTLNSSSSHFVVPSAPARTTSRERTIWAPVFEISKSPAEILGC